MKQRIPGGGGGDMTVCRRDICIWSSGRYGKEMRVSYEEGPIHGPDGFGADTGLMFPSGPYGPLLPGMTSFTYQEPACLGAGEQTLKQTLTWHLIPDIAAGTH